MRAAPVSAWVQVAELALEPALATVSEQVSDLATALASAWDLASEWDLALARAPASARPVALPQTIVRR